MTQLQRIREMEHRLDSALRTLDALEQALEAYRQLRPELEALAAYYTGPLWRQDLADDEAGRLPAELKRGVLSQDAVDALLCRHRALLEQLRSLSPD